MKCEQALYWNPRCNFIRQPRGYSGSLCPTCAPPPVKLFLVKFAETARKLLGQIRRIHPHIASLTYHPPCAVGTWRSFNTTSSSSFRARKEVTAVRFSYLTQSVVTFWLRDDIRSRQFTVLSSIINSGISLEMVNCAFHLIHLLLTLVNSAFADCWFYSGFPKIP